MSTWPSVLGLLTRAARLRPDHPAVVGVQDRWSYRDLHERVRLFAGHLTTGGIAPGARVAILADNCPAFIAAYYAVPAAGGVLLPLNTRLTSEEIAYICADADVAVLLTDSAGLDRCVTASDGRWRVALLDDLLVADRGLAAAIMPGEESLLRMGSPAHVRYLYYTSGTTGRPKGVMLSTANVLSGALGSAAALDMTHQDVWLHAGPLFHLADAWAVWGTVGACGTQVVDRFDAQRAVALIERERVTQTLLVPTALAMLAEAAATTGSLHSLRAVGFGGAPMTRGIYAAARRQLPCPLLPTYGATELSGICAALPAWAVGDPDDDASWASVGHETSTMTIRVIGPAGSDVADGDAGEIVVRSPAAMVGYWRAPAATRDTLREDGLHTGDLGRRDDAGRLHIVGRLKDMIISGGENVYPAEVEHVLLDHPAVQDVAVVGRVDERWGETVTAVVVTADGLTLSELQAFARRRLAGYKVPRDLVILSALPRTASGKVDKTRLRLAADATQQPT